ncbi:MAG: protein kinase [Eubacteriales bacterium]
MDRKFRTGESVFDHWEICGKIRQSSYASYYQLQHSDRQFTYQTQLKLVSIPRNLQDLVMIQGSGQDFSQYVQSVLSYVLEEITLQNKLEGNPNILYYYDHKVEMHPNGMGCDVLIRTELLPTVVEYAQDNPLSQGDILRMGIDIAKALEDCHHQEIIHRDIQPQFIYATNSGAFKLSDFRPKGDIPQEEESHYMAPEMCRGERYDQTVDIYSLGLVMYQFLNRGRLAFTPEGRGHHLKEEAKQIRLSGAMLPPPYFGRKGRLGKILARACHPKPEFRYHSAREFRTDLESVKKQDGMPVFPYRPSFRFHEMERKSIFG